MAAPLTEASIALFKYLADDSFNWSGTPLVDISKEERGNLTQLKRAKLLVTYTDSGDSFAYFTQAGSDLAATYGFDGVAVTA